jgi:hypothetical protein
MNPVDVLPRHLRKFLLVTEIDDSALIVEPVFRRKFGQPPPTMPRHLGAFHIDSEGAARLLCYSHMLPFGDVYLSGGSCTDGAVYRAMPDEQRQELTEAGGPYLWVLKHAFAKFAGDCEAFFGYSADARALEVAAVAGFEATDHPRIMVHWHKPLHEVMRRALIAKAAAIGPF